MEPSRPEIFINETSTGVHSIAAVSTSTTAFLGVAETGPLDRAVLVTSFADFRTGYGGFRRDSYLAHAAFQFFTNGGSRLYVLRVGASAADCIAALPRLDPVTDLNLLAVPGIGDRAVLEAAAAYCERRADCFFVAEAGRGIDDPAEVRTFVESLPPTSYAALYHPWLTMTDPLEPSATPLPVPPSGFVTGIYARVDAQRGVWKAPTGVDANVRGAVAPVGDLTDAQLNGIGRLRVNTIRVVPAQGLVLSGARTLDSRPGTEFPFVPVRRLATFLERSIAAGTQWAVFEPNGEQLWARLRLSVGAFLTSVFRAGGFAAQIESQAFMVRCDAQTMTQEEMRLGIVTMLVGFAPLRPAEFVILRISLPTAG